MSVLRASYAEVACDRLDRVLVALGCGFERRDRMRGQLRRLMMPWGDRAIGSRPEYWSIASNDGMPVEVSVAWDRLGTQVRVYVEPLGDPPGPVSCREAGAAAIRRLAEIPGVCLDPYRAVEELFLTTPPAGGFSVLNAIVWDGACDPWYKVYLNPQARGLSQAGAVLAVAVRRLGVEQGWERIRGHCRGWDLASQASEPALLALDLRDAARGRVKIYLRHAGVTAGQIEAWAGGADDHQPGAVATVCRLVTGHYGPYLGKPPVTSWTLGRGHTGCSLTVYLPLDPNISDDLTARNRVCAVLREAGLDQEAYLATLSGLARRPLGSISMQTYLGYRPGTLPRASVYYATGAYHRAGEAAGLAPLTREGSR